MLEKCKAKNKSIFLDILSLFRGFIFSFQSVWAICPFGRHNQVQHIIEGFQFWTCSASIAPTSTRNDCITMAALKDTDHAILSIASNST